MKQYLDLIHRLLQVPHWTENRTAHRTKAIQGANIEFDLKTGFPAITLRRVPFKSAMGELCGFLRGATSAAEFRALGCKYWDLNANANTAWLSNPFRKGEDDIGQCYGAVWRRWTAYRELVRGESSYFEKRDRLQAQGFQLYLTGEEGVTEIYKKQIDQLGECVRKLIENPSDRRILFHGWDPALVNDIALPSCHILYQFLPDPNTRTLSLQMLQRSADLPLGIPSNLISCGALLELVARLTGFTPGKLQVQFGDVHFYENQTEMMEVMAKREPLESPRLVISDRIPKGLKDVNEAIRWLSLVEPGDFELRDYQCHEAISAPMAV